MKSKTTLGIAAIATILAIATSGILAAPAFAVQRNNIASSNQAGGNTQNGLVNAGNVQANVDVGANVCALSTNC
jgi:hypothetical protein